MLIHPTAVVDKTAEIDASAEVGPYVVIEGPVRVAANVMIYPHAYLCGHTRVGENCRIHMGAVVGHVPQDRAFSGRRSYCEIGPNTTVREYATIHRGTDPESTTTVGADCLLGATSHVAHNCTVGDRVILMNGVLLGGHVGVGPGAFLSGNVGVHQFARVGELVMVSGGAALACDVPPFLVAYGRNRVSGINRVGLVRAGMTPQEIDEIRQAFRLLYRSGKLMPQSIAQLAETLATPAGRRMVEFLRADRKRPLVRPRPARSGAMTSE